MDHKTNRELEATIAAAPDDPAPYLAYARWLIDNGDPRGELIELDGRLTEAERRGPLAERRREIIGRQTEEFRSLAPSFFPHGWQIVWSRGFIRDLTLRISCGRDRQSTTQLRSLLAHPFAKFVRNLALEQIATGDGAWPLPHLAEAHLPALDRFFVACQAKVDLAPLRGLFSRPGWLGTYNTKSCFDGGRFPHVRALDLRDHDVQWPPHGPGSWPDLEVLALRPRGGREASLAWASRILESVEPFPRLREFVAYESKGDELLALILASPLLPQIRRLDFTDTLTNRGAELLHESADKLQAAEEIWIGSTGTRRAEAERWAGPGASSRLPPIGELEIDGRWRSRLSQRLRGRVRFEIPAGYPNL